MAASAFRPIVIALLALTAFSNGAVIKERQTSQGNGECQQTSVLILGAGTAGITAAQALHNQSVDDFIIVEYNNGIGGRVRHTEFGNPPYVVELGANWVQGLGSPGGSENPIWTLAKKYNLTNHYSNYSDLLTYDQNGSADFGSLFDDYEDAYSNLEQDAGQILTNNYLDRSARAGFSLSGWNPGRNKKAQSVEWWDWDWEDAYSPDQSSELFGIAGYNTTYYQYSQENNYVFDQRGFNAFIIGEANTFLQPNDSRLHLNTVINNVSYTNDDVTAYTANNTCIRAQHAICTFSLGVLQNSLAGLAPVTFEPDFPNWKQAAIAEFDMGIYTKIFLQFDVSQRPQFWPTDTEFFLYASPIERGYYPLWQSLSLPNFLPGSGILFVTVVTPQSMVAEAQSDDDTKAQVLAVLRQMYGAEAVPDPVAFMYPRWGTTEWAFGSYSNWPTGVTIQQHQNLRANMGNLWFAGEHTSAEYFGFLHGAWFEGQMVGTQVAQCLKGNQTACGGEENYPVLYGTQDMSAFGPENGWDVTSFQTIGDTG